MLALPVLEHQLIVLSVVMLAIMTTAQLPEFAEGRRSFALPVGLLAAVVLALATAIAIRWVRESQGPFLTLYDILLSNIFSLGAVSLYMIWRHRHLQMTLLLSGPLLMLMGIWLVRVPSQAVPLPATFENYWLWLHVLSGKVFLGVCLVSASSAGLLLLARFAPRSRLAIYLAARPEIRTAVWSSLFLAFVFHSLMLLAGSVWAHSAWGRYWSWDPLETWTLATWIVLGGILHARATFKNMPDTLGYGLVVGVFALAFLTFLGVPFLSIAPHKGVM